MKAVIETGGKQYYVEEGTELYIEKLDVESGKEVTFDKVLNIFLNKIFPFKKSYILTILISLITIFALFIVMIDNFNLLLFLSIM